MPEDLSRDAGVTERTSWGFPNFRVDKKMYAACGTGHGGPHLCFKVADHSAAAGDARYKLISEVGSWKGYEDWYFYYFDWARKDDWAKLKHLMEVSWELHFAKLPQKKQDAILAPKPKAKKPVTARGGAAGRPKKRPTRVASTKTRRR